MLTQQPEACRHEEGVGVRLGIGLIPTGVSGPPESQSTGPAQGEGAEESPIPIVSAHGLLLFSLL